MQDLKYAEHLFVNINLILSPFAKLFMKFILKAPITTATDNKYKCDFFLNIQTNKCYPKLWL